MMATVNKNIVLAMEKRNVTRNEFAEMLGVTYSAVTAWANGTSTPSFKNVEKIAKILGATPKEIDPEYIEGRQRPPKRVWIPERGDLGKPITYFTQKDLSNIKKQVSVGDVVIKISCKTDDSGERKTIRQRWKVTDKNRRVLLLSRSVKTMYGQHTICESCIYKDLLIKDHYILG